VNSPSFNFSDQAILTYSDVSIAVPFGEPDLVELQVKVVVCCFINEAGFWVMSVFGGV